jgi:hypothetical protein
MRVEATLNRGYDTTCTRGLQKLSDMDQPETPELETLRAISEFRCPRFEDLSNEERGKLGDFRAPNCNVFLDLEWMEWVRACRILRH